MSKDIDCKEGFSYPGILCEICVKRERVKRYSMRDSIQERYLRINYMSNVFKEGLNERDI